jgi:MFS family permease
MSEAASPRRLVVALAPGVMLSGIAAGMVFPILPIVGMRVGLPLAFIGLVLAANRIARVIVATPVGLLVDRFGGRRTLLAGLVAQALVAGLFVLGVVTPHAGLFFLLGRIGHGIASSCVFVAAGALAIHGGGAEHGGRVAGGVRAATQIGVPVGLVAGGFLSDLVGEASTFEMSGVALLLAAAHAWVSVPDLRVAPGPRTSLLATLRIVDLRLAAVGALGFVSAFAGSGMVLTTTTLLVHARGFSVFGLPERATAGVLMGWLVLAEALAMPWLGRLGDRFDAHARVALGGLALVVPALAMLGFSQRLLTVGIWFAVLGVGVAGLGPSLISLVGRFVPAERRGLGVGALQVATDIGGAAGPLVGSALFTGSLETPYLVTAAISALFLPVGWMLVRRTSSDRATS